MRILTKSGKRVRRDRNAPRYRRGKENPFVEQIDQCEQLEGDLNEFRDDCCVRCNNLEVVRAINTNNKVLFDTIMKSDKKISSRKFLIHPKAKLNIQLLCIEKRRDDMLEELTKESKDVD